MNIRWRRAALVEARDIRRLIALDHPRRSREWRRELETRIEILRDWPRAGRVIPEFGEENLRELVFGNYRIWYFVTRDAVEIMRIWDARQEAPTEIREAPLDYLALTLAPAAESVHPRGYRSLGYSRWYSERDECRARNTKRPRRAGRAA